MAFRWIPTVLLTLITQVLGDDGDAICFIRTCSELSHRMKSLYQLRSTFHLKLITPSLSAESSSEKAHDTTWTVPFGDVWKRPTHFIGLIHDLIISLPHELDPDPTEVNRLRELLVSPIWPQELIPASVRRIKLDDTWKRNGSALIELNLPPYLVEFSSSQVDNSIVESLTTNQFDQLLKHLTSLHLPLFQLPLDLSHMTTLRTLKLGRWNLPTDNLRLPDSLEKLSMGNSFSQSIDNWILPPNLIYLQLNGARIESLKWKQDQLSSSLTDLNYYTDVLIDRNSGADTEIPLQSESALGPIDSTQLPHGLVRLSVPCLFESPFSKVVLPPGLHELNICWLWSHRYRVDLEQRGHIQLHFSQLRLPNQLQRLNLRFGTLFSLQDVQLPAALTDLVYSDNGETFPPLIFKTTPNLRMVDLSGGDGSLNLQEIEYWPSSLRILKFSPSFGYPLKNLILPDQVEELILTPFIGSSTLPRILPRQLKLLRFDHFSESGCLEQLSREQLPNLRTLILGNESPESTLPRFADSLRTLELNHHSRMNPSIQSLASALPSQLTSLSLCGSFNCHLFGNILPGSLTRLTLGREFDSNIQDLILPPPMRRLIFQGNSRFNRLIHRLILPPDLLSITLPAGYSHPIQSLTRQPTAIRDKDGQVRRFPYGQQPPKWLYQPPVDLSDQPITIFF